MTCLYCNKIIESKDNKKKFCNEIHKKAYSLLGAIDEITKNTLQNKQEKKEVKRIKEEINLRHKLFGKKYKDCTFDNFICNTDYQKDVKKRIIQITESIKNGNGYIVALIGFVGTGKDHLCSAMVHYLGFKKIEHKTIMQISREIRESDKQQKILSKYTNNDLLFINEIGIQSCTNFERNILHEIIDTIYRDMKSCILISNENKENFKNCIDYPGLQRVWDRIDRKIIFKGGSYRPEQRRDKCQH